MVLILVCCLLKHGVVVDYVILQRIMLPLNAMFIFSQTDREINTVQFKVTTQSLHEQTAYRPPI